MLETDYSEVREPLFSDDGSFSDSFADSIKRETSTAVVWDENWDLSWERVKYSFWVGNVFLE